MSNSVVSHLEAEAESTNNAPLQTTPPVEEDNTEVPPADEAVEETVDEEEESDDDDVCLFAFFLPSSIKIVSVGYRVYHGPTFTDT